MAEQPPQLPPDLPPDPAKPPPLAAMWYVHMSDGTQGPLTREGVSALISGGRVGYATYVWGPGCTQWAPAATYPDFASMQFAELPISETGDTNLKGTLKNTRQEAIALFIVFLLCLGLVVFAFSVTAKSLIFMLSEGVMFLVCALVFAIACLAQRWRTLRSLPGVYLVLACIGGFGLIALMAGLIIFLLFGLSAGIPPQQ